MELRRLGNLMREARDRVNENREKQGYAPFSQDDIAQGLKVSKTTVSDWERGAKQPKALNLIAYCELLGVTLDELLGVKKNA